MILFAKFILGCSLGYSFARGVYLRDEEPKLAMALTLASLAFLAIQLLPA